MLIYSDSFRSWRAGWHTPLCQHEPLRPAIPSWSGPSPGAVTRAEGNKGKGTVGDVASVAAQAGCNFSPGALTFTASFRSDRILSEGSNTLQGRSAWEVPGGSPAAAKMPARPPQGNPEQQTRRKKSLPQRQRLGAVGGSLPPAPPLVVNSVTKTAGTEGHSHSTSGKDGSRLSAPCPPPGARLPWKQSHPLPAAEAVESPWDGLERSPQNDPHEDTELQEAHAGWGALDRGAELGGPERTHTFISLHSWFKRRTKPQVLGGTTGEANLAQEGTRAVAKSPPG